MTRIMHPASLANLLAFCLICLSFAGIARAQSEAPSEPPSAPRLREANADFAFRYFRVAAEAHPEANTLLMPWGLSYTFGLLQNGASDKAKKEIETGFGFQGLTSEGINESFAYLHFRLAGEPGPQPPPRQPLIIMEANRYRGLRFSSHFWLKSPLQYRPEFLATNERHYRHYLHRLPDNPHAALQEINATVRADTAGAVTETFSALEKEHFVLLSTTNLQCGWGKPFNEQKTQDAAFYLLSGKQTIVPMMADDGLYRYVRAEGFQAIELHCDNYRLQILLPDKDSSLHALRQQLNLTNWREWVSSMKTIHINLKLPRFKITGAENVRQHLEKMGVQEVFGSFQSLRPMVTVAEGGQLTQAVERTSLEVDEHGLRAGSVVGVGGVLGGILAGPPPPEFVVDRPFLFVISHWDGTVLYIGMVLDPIPMKLRSEGR